MTVAAFVAHRIPGRTRLRIPTEKGNPIYFAVLAESLAICPGVEQVTTDARTASLVLHHSADATLGEIADWAEQAHLFRVVEAGVGAPRAVHAAAGQIHLLDTKLRRITHGRADLRSLLFFVFVGLGIFQVTRGKVLSTASPFFWYAFDLLRRESYTAPPTDRDD